jgi:penicillin-binding protein 2
MSKTDYSHRRFILLAVIFLCGIIFIIRLFYIQIIDEKYKASANDNVLRKIYEHPSRGLIYDRNGKLLVYNDAIYDLMVVPRLVNEIDTLQLCRIAQITKEEFIQKLNKAAAYSPVLPSIFLREIPENTYGYFQENVHLFSGFYIQATTVRKYPTPIAAHALGYMGEVNPDGIEKDGYYRMGDNIGISGIEKSYEKYLRGRKGVRLVMVDVHNKEKGSYRNGAYDTTAIAGINLYSSLDADLQEYSEKLMQNKKGGIVVLDPSNGEILTMVSAPYYDPNRLISGKERGNNYAELLLDETKPLYNRAIMTRYPPGSVFKMPVGLIAMQEKVVSPDQRIFCSGGFNIGGGHIIQDHFVGPADMQIALQHSSNAYFCNVFRKTVDNPNYENSRIAYNKWRSYLLNMGFGRSLDVDLPNESPGFIPTVDFYNQRKGISNWRATSIISIAIGQGEIGVTPLQLANMSAFIANRGYYYIPHIINGVGKPGFIDSKYKKQQQVNINKEYFESIVLGMRDVVLSGTATAAYIPNIVVCGKTGTVQDPPRANHSVFVAFAPMDNPKIAVAVLIENAGYGSTWAAPIASLIIEKYLNGEVKRMELENRMINANLMDVKKYVKTTNTTEETSETTEE